MSDSASDSVPALAASVSHRKVVIRGHRPSVMNSVDLSDESRDTVEMKDSDDWYPQFAPSATLQPAKKLENDKKSGQQDTRDGKEREGRHLRASVSKMSITRMMTRVSRSRCIVVRFEEGHSLTEHLGLSFVVCVCRLYLCCVSPGLSALLANRMAKSAFEDRFLGGADLSTLSQQHTSSSSSHSSPAIMQAKEASAESLFNRSAKLGALLANRPDKARLESMNVLKAPQGNSASGGAFAGMQAKLEASQKRDRLNALLMARPDQGSLVKRGLLVNNATPDNEPRERLASAKSALGGFFASRPNPEQLVKQKIITDIGDLPGGLERKQENQLIPHIVEEFVGKKIQSVSLGFSHTLALDSEGIVYAFGSGANGRLGLTDGSFADVTRPTPLPTSHFGGESVIAIDAGENHSAAITVSGKLFTWGTGAWGRLGLGNQDDQSLPRQVTLPENEVAQAVSCGAYHSLVLSKTNKLYAFGWNKNGRCGVGRKHPSLLILEPVRIPDFPPTDSDSPILSIEAGAGYSFAFFSNGSIYLWGSGSFGGLGFGEEQDVWIPTLLGGVTRQPYVNVAIGATHTLAVRQDGQVESWGSNDKGQLGRVTSEHQTSTSASSSSASASSVVPSPQSSYSPGLIPSLRGVTLAAGKSHSLAVDSNGLTYAWGMGSRGILGLGDEHDQHMPTVITTLKDSNIKQVDAAWTHSAALTQDGQLYTWGAKNNGRLGY